jgi:hypothetical protein
MIPKATEDTVSRYLANELEKRGVKADTITQILTPDGPRKPDILCTNGGTYPIEAKFEKEFEAVGDLYTKYLMYHPKVEVQGGFALVYPKELSRPMPQERLEKLVHELKFKVIAMFPPEDTRRGYRRFEGKLSEIADFLAKHILTPPTYVEPDVDGIIDNLRAAAEYLVNGLRHLSGEQLEGFFGGEDVFKIVLQFFEKEKYPVEDLRLAAAYILVNQLLFYHVLSKRRPKEFQEINAMEIKKPTDLRKFFSKVMEANYRAVFSFDVASLIPERYVAAVREMINVLKGLAPEKVGGGSARHDISQTDTARNEKERGCILHKRSRR